MYSEPEIQHYYRLLKNRAANMRFVVLEHARLAPHEQVMAGAFAPKKDDPDGWLGEILFYRASTGVPISCEELATFAHEVGHGRSMLLGLRSCEYERALDRFNAGGEAPELLKADSDLIVQEEARAWVLGLELLGDLGYRDLAGFRQHAVHGLAHYETRLKRSLDADRLMTEQQQLAAGARIQREGTVARLAALPRGEETLTQTLAEVLRVPKLRRAVLGRVAVVHGEEHGLCYVAPESIHDVGKGVPDIVLRGPRLFVVFENKLNSSFTAHQPHEYYVQLKKWRAECGDGAALFVVVAPESRIESLRSKVAERIQETADVPVSYVSWQRLAKDAGNAASEVFELGLVQLFKAQIEELMEPTPTKVTEGAAKLVQSQQLGAAVVEYERLLADLRVALNDTPKLKLTANLDRSTFTFTGFTFWRTETDWIWVGLSFQVLADTGRGPLIAQVSSRSNLYQRDIIFEAQSAQDRYDWDFAPVVELDATMDAAKLVAVMLNWLVDT